MPAVGRTNPSQVYFTGVFYSAGVALEVNRGEHIYSFERYIEGFSVTPERNEKMISNANRTHHDICTATFMSSYVMKRQYQISKIDLCVNISATVMMMPVISQMPH